MHYVREDDFICNVVGKYYIVFEDHMDQIKGKRIDSDIITSMYGENPTQEYTRKKINNKECITYHKK
jgi:hypothetical protein